MLSRETHRHARCHPVNRKVHLLMHAKDVGHSFLCGSCCGSDFVPGWMFPSLTATKVGRYEWLHPALCWGLQHEGVSRCAVHDI